MSYWSMCSKCKEYIPNESYRWMWIEYDWLCAECTKLAQDLLSKWVEDK